MIMGYLRFIWTLIVVIILFTLSIPLLLIDLLVGVFSMDLRDRLTMFIVHVAFRVILFVAGTRLHVTGFENIPKDEPVLYIGNHRSFFDVLTSYSRFPKITSFIAKKEFKPVPFLSWWMMVLHNLFLDRKDIKQGMKIILKAIEYVKGGMSICIFPEGTRNRTEEDILPFHEGSFKIADKTNCAIIPMTMYNMSAMLEDHFPKVISSDVYIDFGKPVYPNDLSKEERKTLGSYVRNIMLEKYKELKDIHEKSNVK